MLMIGEQATKRYGVNRIFLRFTDLVCSRTLIFIATLSLFYAWYTSSVYGQHISLAAYSAFDVRSIEGNIFL